MQLSLQLIVLVVYNNELPLWIQGSYITSMSSSQSH